MSERMDRYKDLLPVDHIKRDPVWVIGCGSGGRQSAILLASMGCENVTLVDFDTVEAHNMGTQGWWPEDLTQKKVVTLTMLLYRVNSDIKVMTLDKRFERVMARDWDSSHGIFCCVDDMGAREVIWDCAREKGAFFVDGRMGAEVGEVFSCVPGDYDWYQSTLFAQGEVYEGRCTMKSTLYCAACLDSIMVAQWTKWLRGCTVQRKLVLNLLAGTMGKDHSVGDPPIQ